MPHDDVADLLIDSRRLRVDASWRELRRRVETGDLAQVRRGTFADATALAALHIEQRHQLEVLAAVRAQGTDSAVISHVSAAVMWDLPLFGVAPRKVHITMRHGLEAHSSNPVLRHRDELPEADVTMVGGIRCTSLERTVIDVARTASLATGVAAADAALRRIAWNERSWVYAADEAERFKEGLRARVARMAGRRGVRRARHVIEFADGRAQLPGESVSRVLLAELGFTDIRLQVRIPNGRGGWYHVDFGLPEADAWGEFDGLAKYVDPSMTDGRSPRDVVRAEKEREDWIRASTNRPVARWSFADLGSAAALRRRLAIYGIRPPY